MGKEESAFATPGENATVVVNEHGRVITGWANVAAEQQEDPVDGDFGFLGESQATLLHEILVRRDSDLIDRLRHSASVSTSDAAAIVSILSDELTENLDDDWEPTAYGRTVSAVLARFNMARLDESWWEMLDRVRAARIRAAAGYLQ